MQNDVIGEPLGQKDFDAIQGKETNIKLLLVDALFYRHCCIGHDDVQRPLFRKAPPLDV